MFCEGTLADARLVGNGFGKAKSGWPPWIALK